MHYDSRVLDVLDGTPKYRTTAASSAAILGRKRRR
jgi:hypothetical protein